MARIDDFIHWWLQWCFLTGRLSALRVVGSLYSLLHCRPLHCLFSIEISNISNTTFILYRTLSFLLWIPQPLIISLHLLFTEVSFVLICLYLPWLTQDQDIWRYSPLYHCLIMQNVIIYKIRNMIKHIFENTKENIMAVSEGSQFMEIKTDEKSNNGLRLCDQDWWWRQWSLWFTALAFVWPTWFIIDIITTTY